MPISYRPNGQHQNKNEPTDEESSTPAEQRKQDALDFAELIYDVFVASESSDNMDEKG